MIAVKYTFVDMLCIVTERGLLMKQNKIYKLICYIWFLVPVLSLIVLSMPMVTSGISSCVAPIPEVTYNGFQVLIHGNLVNYKKDVVIGMSIELLFLKIMIAMQIIFDVIIILILLWEWRKNKKISYGLEE